MTPDRYRQICHYFEEAQRYSPGERTAFLERACPDQQLRLEVTQFLADAEDAERDGFLQAACFPKVREVFDGTGDDAWMGLHVGQYEIRRRIAGGGMGVVYEAWQPELKRRVALKTMRAGFQAGTGELARFRTEAEAAARLQHPNIVPIYEIGVWSGDSVNMSMPYLAMEYVDGGSLDMHIAGTPQPPLEAAFAGNPRLGCALRPRTWNYSPGFEAGQHPLTEG
jgi:serine/threonine-protein kinase